MSSSAASPLSWAVAAAWRGDPALLAHTVRVVRDRVAEAEGAVPPCRIAVRVPGSRPLVDTERFDDPDAFVASLSHQALRRWTEIEVEASGGRHRVYLRLGRDGWRGGRVPGTLVLVSGPDAGPIRDAVAVTLSRGGFVRFAGPTSGEGTAAEADAALEAVTARRRHVVGRLAALVGIATSSVMTVMGALVAVQADHSSEGTAVGVAAIGVGMTLMAGVCVFRRGLFPAVDLATLTPGRRVAQRVTGVVGVSSLVSLGGQYLAGLISGG